MAKKPHWKSSGMGLGTAVKKIQGMSKPVLYVGIFEKSQYFSGLKTAQVGYWMEFGTPTVPARSFMRSTFAEKRSEWVKNTIRAIRKTGLLNAKDPINRAFEILGPQVEDDIKSKIDSNISPPLKQATIVAKQRALVNKGTGSTRVDPDAFIDQGIALIHTGQLRSSISYTIDEGGKK